MSGLILLPLLGALFYLMVMPQRRQAKAQRELLAALQEGTPLNVGDRTTIAGREATLYELVIPGNDPSLPAGTLQVWLDDQYAYPLAWRDSNGRELRFTSVIFNQEIDPLTFVFFPPPGASVRRVDPSQ